MKQKNYFKQYDNTVVYFLWDKYYQQYIKGVSVCSPEDTFDLNTGINIARQKALVKLHSRYARVYEEQLKFINQCKLEEEYITKQRKYWRTKAKESLKKLTITINKLK